MHALPPSRASLVPNAIAFRDPSHGLLGTGRNAPGTISLTTDGGRTWKVAFRTPRPVVAVAYSDAAELAQFDDGETLQSTDGGHSWSPASAPLGSPPPPCPLAQEYHVVVTPQRNEWAVCNHVPGAGNVDKEVYRLGRRAWKLLAATPIQGKGRGGIASGGYPHGIAMADDGFGFIWESRGPLYVTRDGGVRWSALPHVEHPDIDEGVSGFALRKGVGFVLLAKGGTVNRRLLETTNAGSNWRVVHTWN